MTYEDYLQHTNDDPATREAFEALAAYLENLNPAQQEAFGHLLETCNSMHELQGVLDGSKPDLETKAIGRFLAARN